MNTCPHSVHSFRAVKSLLIVTVFNSMSGCPELLASLISVSAATALATTCKENATSPQDVSERNC